MTTAALLLLLGALYIILVAALVASIVRHAAAMGRREPWGLLMAILLFGGPLGIVIVLALWPRERAAQPI